MSLRFFVAGTKSRSFTSLRRFFLHHPETEVRLGPRSLRMTLSMTGRVLEWETRNLRASMNEAIEEAIEVVRTLKLRHGDLELRLTDYSSTRITGCLRTFFA